MLNRRATFEPFFLAALALRGFAYGKSAKAVFIGILGWDAFHFWRLPLGFLQVSYWALWIVFRFGIFPSILRLNLGLIVFASIQIWRALTFLMLCLKLRSYLSVTLRRISKTSCQKKVTYDLPALWDSGSIGALFDSYFSRNLVCSQHSMKAWESLHQRVKNLHSTPHFSRKFQSYQSISIWFYWSFFPVLTVFRMCFEYWWKNHDHLWDLI